jgi:hypothetical protein
VRPKPAKRAKTPKYERRTEYKRLEFRRDYSEQGLDEFLRAGAGGSLDY